MQFAYSWNMDYIPYDDDSGYEARFYKCGIYVLMKEYGYFDLVPAMCHLDYTMSKLGGATNFVREYTLASGGPYLKICGYLARKTRVSGISLLQYTAALLQELPGISGHMKLCISE